MMLLRHILLSLFIIVSVPSLAQATGSYLEVHSIPPTLLAAPFADKSPEQRNELQYILNLQQHASADEVKKAADEREMSPEMMTEPIVPALKRADYPEIYHLLERVGDTSKTITNNTKGYWKANRPYIVDTTIKPLIKAHTNYAYPSGHTSKSHVWAYTLGMLLPEDAALFRQKAESIAQHRVLVGMHFPHDIEGGKQLSLLIIGGLLQNPTFLADLEKAQNELKAHPLPSAAEGK